MTTYAVRAALAAASLAGLSPGAAEAQEGYLVPCLGLAADQSPVFPTEILPDPTTEVSACFRLGADESADRLTAVFIAEDVGAAAPPDFVIAETDLDLQGQKQGRFRFENPRPMPLGAYRVDVSADGRLGLRRSMQLSKERRQIRQAISCRWRPGGAGPTASSSAPARGPASTCLASSRTRKESTAPR